MSEAKRQELMGLVGTMVQLGYIRMDEVPAIPHRKAPLEVAVYAPLSKMPCPPDLVLVRGTAAQLMVLVEAAQAAASRRMRRRWEGRRARRSRRRWIRGGPR